MATKKTLKSGFDRQQIAKALLAAADALSPVKAFGERMKYNATPREFQLAVNSAPHHEVRRSFYGRPDTGTGGMDATYVELGTTVAEVHVDYRRGKEVSRKYAVNLDYIEGKPDTMSASSESEPSSSPDPRRAKRVAKAKAVVKKLLNDLDEVEEYEGYSGRGMYGMASPYAIVTDVHPGSEKGKKLIKFGGFAYDNMGRDFIYYLL